MELARKKTMNKKFMLADLLISALTVEVDGGIGTPISSLPFTHQNVSFDLVDDDAPFLVMIGKCSACSSEVRVRPRTHADILKFEQNGSLALCKECSSKA